MDQHESEFSATEKTPASPQHPGEAESNDAVIQRLLTSYQIGQKIKALRLRNRIALADVGKRIGLSASMLSQLENGKLVPTLPTLARIAVAFNTGLDHFFDNPHTRKLFSVVRSGEKKAAPAESLADFWFGCLAFAAPDKGLQAYLADFPKREANEAQEHRHDGTEFLYVIDGAVVIRYQGEDHALQSGDSAYFDSSEPHSYRGAAEAPSKAIVIAMPPRL